MNNLSGGYIMVDLSSPNKVKQLAKAAALNKPLLVYYEDGTTEWGKVTVTYETVDDVEVPTYHITTANGFVTVEADGDVSVRPLIIEGDGEGLEQEGVTISYCKWSLSGTHLMLVCAGTIANTTVISNNTDICKFTLPDYIFNKIVTVWGENIDVRNISLWSQSFTSQQLYTKFVKGIQYFKFTSGANLTLTDERSFRIQFDLLIDNE